MKRDDRVLVEALLLMLGVGGLMTALGGWVFGVGYLVGALVCFFSLAVVSIHLHK
jgi:hypothetical protein